MSAQQGAAARACEQPSSALPTNLAQFPALPVPNPALACMRSSGSLSNLGQRASTSGHSGGASRQVANRARRAPSSAAPCLPITQGLSARNCDQVQGQRQGQGRKPLESQQAAAGVVWWLCLKDEGQQWAQARAAPSRTRNCRLPHPGAGITQFSLTCSTSLVELSSCRPADRRWPTTWARLQGGGSGAPPGGEGRGWQAGKQV